MMRRSTRTRAFTLLELLVVLVLVALVSTMVVMNLGGPHHAALAEQAVGRWVLVDRQLRHHSQRFRRPAELSFELKGGSSLTRTDLHRDKPIGSAIDLPSRVRIDQYVCSAKKATSKRGKVAIRFSPYGQTDTYAVCLKGPGYKEIWLLFLGVTGEVKRDLTEIEVHEALLLSAT